MNYYFGHGADELNRLVTQATVLRPVTERMLKAIGLRAGGRVLDVGCGAGDVSMLVSELAPNAEVVGIDASPKAIELSRWRAEQTGFRNVSFKQTSLESLDEDEVGSFDFVVGRFVVLHQPSPVSFLQRSAAKLRPGGTVAFHEIDLRREFDSLPASPLFDAATAELMRAIRAGAPSPDVAARFVELFKKAGLPSPALHCERAAGDANSALIPWIASTLAAVRTIEQGALGRDAVDDLAKELARALVASESQISSPDQCCAWARI